MPTTIIYDGECPVCNGLKDYAAGQIQAGQAEYMPFQNGNLPANLTEGQVRRSLWVILENGERLHGARAVFAIMSQMGRFWGLVGQVLSWPPFIWLAEPAYRLFARYRHWISKQVA